LSVCLWPVHPSSESPRAVGLMTVSGSWRHANNWEIFGLKFHVISPILAAIVTKDLLYIDIYYIPMEASSYDMLYGQQIESERESGDEHHRFPRQGLLYNDIESLLKLLLIYHHSKICGPEMEGAADSSQESHHGCMIPHDCLSMKLWIYHEMVCSKESQDCDQCRFIELLKCTSSLFMLLIRTRGLHTPTKKQLL
jgi:hypothetical protein